MYILASGSPRRRELMNLITKDFISEVSGCDEFVPEGTPPEQIPAILAEQKAQAVAKNHPDDIVIGSDTIVVLDGRVFGKPKTPGDAVSMLHTLSGRIHTVYTGVAVVEHGKTRSFVQSADVEFFELSDEFIRRYVATGDPLDKAGAYGIQGPGALLIKGIVGDYYNVMGFPVSAVARFLGLIP